MQSRVAVIHGPNMNLLGQREQGVYGRISLDDLNNNMRQIANKSYISLEIFQSNHEGSIVDFIHKCSHFNAIVINAAAYTHTSIAIRDALLSINVPFVEVHISNIFARDKFRAHSYLSDIAVGVITGLGENSYYYALEFMINRIADV